MDAFHLEDLNLNLDRLEPVRPDRPVAIASDLVARREYFPDEGPFPWLDRDDADERIDRLLATGAINETLASLYRYWREHGYVVLKGVFAPEQLDRAWAAYEAKIETGVFSPVEDANTPDPALEKFPGRVLNPHLDCEEIRAIWSDPTMVAVMSQLLGQQALPFQTIAGHKASQQMAHSDTVHMTTYPLGYLTANWIAFEDIGADCGPLEFYPGSHKLPYKLSREAGISLEEGKGGYLPYHQKYEPMVQETIRSNNLKPSYFHAKKGDVLIWHANLLHGGSVRKNADLSRRALVCHYFAEGCLCYHDYSGGFSELNKLTPGRPAEAPSDRGLWDIILPTRERAANRVTRQTFDREAYLAANRDVLEAGLDPWKHWKRWGRKERRPLRP